MASHSQKVLDRKFEHMNGESEVHAADKKYSQGRALAKLAAQNDWDEHNAQYILQLAGLSHAIGRKKDRLNYYCLNPFASEPQVVSGDAYTAALMAICRKLTHYWSESQHQAIIIKRPPIVPLLVTLLPAHSAFLREVLSAEEQAEVLRRLGFLTAKKIVEICGWRLYGWNLHRDSAIDHFDFNASHYADDAPPVQCKTPGCGRLSGDRRGYRRLGFAAMSVFRYDRDGHLESSGSKARKAATLDLTGFYEKYGEDEEPLDLQVSLALDDAFRAQWQDHPRYGEICERWYRAQHDFHCKRALDSLRDALEARACSKEQSEPGLIYLTRLVDMAARDLDVADGQVARWHQADEENAALHQTLPALETELLTLRSSLAAREAEITNLRFELTTARLQAEQNRLAEHSNIDSLTAQVAAQKEKIRALDHIRTAYQAMLNERRDLEQERDTKRQQQSIQNNAEAKAANLPETELQHVTAPEGKTFVLFDVGTQTFCEWGDQAKVDEQLQAYKEAYGTSDDLLVVDFSAQPVCTLTQLKKDPAFARQLVDQELIKNPRSQWLKRRFPRVDRQEIGASLANWSPNEFARLKILNSDPNEKQY